MSRSIISVVAVLAWAASPILAQDNNPTAPLGLAGEAVDDETLRLHWKIAYGNSATSGGPTPKETEIAGLAGPAVAEKAADLKAGDGTGGTPANGYCHHYVLRMSNVPITTLDPGVIVNDNILSVGTGAQEVDFEPWYTVGGLLPNTSYYFSVQAVDATSHFSTVSIIGSAAVTSVDSTIPGACADLTVTEAMINSAIIRWTAPCDDGVAAGSGPVLSFTIRTWPLSDPTASFSTNSSPVAAPLPVDPAGANPVHVLTLNGLNDGETYGIGILANDGSNDSALTTVFATTVAYAGETVGSISGGKCSSSGRPVSAMFGAAALLLGLALLRK